MLNKQRLLLVPNILHSIRFRSRFFTGGSIATSAQTLAFSNLKINRTQNPRPQPELTEDLEFGSFFSDHMLDIDWSEKKGWADPIIRPFSDFVLSPACSVFHYGLELFEGLKAYKDSDKNIRLFRPNLNYARLQASCTALDFPVPDGEQFKQCLYQLLREDENWIPSKKGYSLYIRPTAIATTPRLKVASATDIKLFVVTCPVGPYFSGGFKPISLLATDKHVRAWPGGVGNHKLGANYGPTIKPQKDAAIDGYQQILWLFPNAHTGELHVGEVGAMNLFFFWINAQTGEQELITAPLDGTILPGVTRDSVLTLARGWKEFQVTVREYTMNEVMLALQEKRVLECFGSGTAAIVCPVNEIGFQGQKYAVPLDVNDKNASIGPLTKRFFDTILNIQYGLSDSPIGDDGEPWSLVIPKI